MAEYWGRMVGLVSLLALCLWLSPANAEIMYDNYEDVRRTDWFKTYILGVGIGYSWANTELRVRNLPPLYCQPENLGFNAENYLQILDRYLRKENLKDFSASLGGPLEFSLLKALKKDFPCN